MDESSKRLIPNVHGITMLEAERQKMACFLERLVYRRVSGSCHRIMCTLTHIFLDRKRVQEVWGATRRGLCRVYSMGSSYTRQEK